MIYTVTLNASLDYIVAVEDFKIGYVNRTVSEKMLPGGKGINVSTILQSLGIENKALGFIAGFVGAEIERAVEALGCKQDFIVVPNGVSRINVKLKSNEGTEINGQGPHIRDEDMAKLFQQLDELQEHDILVLAGSIPNSLKSVVYREILDYLQDKNIMIVVDTIKEQLLNVLEKRPFLIKPNRFELGEIFDKELCEQEEIISCACQLQAKGARNVLVSLAGDGAILVTEDGDIYTSKVPEGILVNSVGAGDSMVAGFLSGWLEQKDYEYAFRLGIAAGSASAFSEDLATKEEIVAVLKKLDKVNIMKRKQ